MPPSQPRSLVSIWRRTAQHVGVHLNKKKRKQTLVLLQPCFSRTSALLRPYFTPTSPLLHPMRTHFIPISPLRTTTPLHPFVRTYPCFTPTSHRLHLYYTFTAALRDLYFNVPPLLLPYYFILLISVCNYFALDFLLTTIATALASAKLATVSSSVFFCSPIEATHFSTNYGDRCDTPARLQEPVLHGKTRNTQ